MGTNLGENKNNLFDYATSELSQDAFICWLCNWVNFKDEELSQEERELKRLATRFIEKMMNGYKNNDNEKLDERKINIKKQYKNIDVLLEVKNKTENEIDTYIIIEDKIGTNLHNNQFERYENTIQKETEKEERIKTVYYKIYDQSDFDKIKEEVDMVYTREKILELFEEYSEKIDNVVFRDYYEHLKRIEEKIKSYKTEDIEKWDSSCYVGFFKYLKDEKVNLLEHGRENEGCGWGYVPNSAGGFMGLWWFPLDKVKLDKLVKENENLYLQIEQYTKKEEKEYVKKDIIAVKYSVSDKEVSTDETEIKFEAASKNRKEIYEKLKNKLGDKFYKKIFRVGKYMTVGYLEYDSIKDCEEKIIILQNALKEIEL